MTMDDSDRHDVREQYQSVAVIGAGVIGTSWTALFLAHGLRVVVNDPRPGVETAVVEGVREIVPTLEALGLPTDGIFDNLQFEADLERAVGGVGVVQENGPERLQFKRDLWARVGRAAPDDALLLSSSSAKTATEQSRDMDDANRMLVGHPFNPPHLIPLVEVVPGDRTSPATVEAAVAFYTALGKVPRVLHKEIAGFVANRLQGVLFRESCYLVQQGVVTVDELDDIVTSSIGLRWAADGPFRSFHLGGGPGGFRTFFDQFGRGMAAAWANPSPVVLDEAMQDLVITQADASFGAETFEELEADRDAKQVAIIRALDAAD